LITGDDVLKVTVLTAQVQSIVSVAWTYHWFYSYEGWFSDQDSPSHHLDDFAHATPTSFRVRSLTELLRQQTKTQYFIFFCVPPVANNLRRRSVFGLYVREW